MNKEKLKKCRGYHVRLRPPARSIFDGRQIPQRYDIWIIDSVRRDGVVELLNIITHHRAELGSDHIHHFDSDSMSEKDGLKHGFLTLTMQIFMSGIKLWSEPLPPYKCRRLSESHANTVLEPITTGKDMVVQP